MVSRINEQVLEDIEDWIVMKGFARHYTHVEMHSKIAEHLQQERERAKARQKQAEMENPPEEGSPTMKKEKELDAI